MHNTLIHEGNRLQHWVENSPITKKKIIDGMGLTGYGHFTHYVKQDRVNIKILTKFCEVLGITLEQFYAGPHEKPITEDETEVKKIHHGEAIKHAVTRSGIKATTIAQRMGISRGTLYNWFENQEIDTGTLLHLAQVLNIPVAELKGIGSGRAGFEKDIYLLLQDINQKLEKLLLNAQLQMGT